MSVTQKIPNGNVGIGTSSASVKLSVAGGALFSYDPGPTFSVSLGLDNLNGRQYDLLSSGTDHATNPNGFAIFDRTNAEYRLLIDSSGNVGIGTTTPSSKLAVDGDIYTAGSLSFDANDTSSGLYFPEDNYFARESWNDTADQTGILIPMYIYPSSVFTNDDYNEVIELKNRYKNVPLYVILNPGSGPGTVTDGNYSAAIQRLHGAGATVLGYIATQYMASSTGEMASQIDDWLTYYPEIDGIFMDEMTNTTASNEIEHYETITRYAHGKGLYPVIGNPGSGVGGEYFASPTADIIVTVESGTYPSEADLKGDYDEGYADYTYKKRASLLYGQSDFDTSNITLLKKYTGLVYVS